MKVEKSTSIYSPTLSNHLEYSILIPFLKKINEYPLSHEACVLPYKSTIQFLFKP